MQKNKPGIASFSGFGTTKTADPTPRPIVARPASRTVQRRDLHDMARQDTTVIEPDAARSTTSIIDAAMLQARLDKANEAVSHIARARVEDEDHFQKTISGLREELAKAIEVNSALEKDLHHSREIIKFSNASMPKQLQLAFRTAIVAFVGVAFGTMAYTIFSL